MAQEPPNRLMEWWQLARAQAPIVRRRFEDWLAAVREEPVLAWETPGVRYSVYGFGGLIIVWAASFVLDTFAPAPPQDARPVATRADFHVVCRDPACAHHFVVYRRFGFRKFPVQCPKCSEMTGMRARPCTSSTCRGKWVAPVSADGMLLCPVCGDRFE